MKRILLLSLLLMLIAGITFSQIIHVPAERATIQEAIQEAGDGDTILVAEGTYFENINFLGKAITVASQFILDKDTSHISKTVIDGSESPWPDSASVVTMTSGEDTTSILMGFTITGGTGTKWYGNSAYELTNYLLGGGILIFGNGARITNNIIEKNRLTYLNGQYTYPDSLPWGAGIAALVRYGHSLIIEDNVIRDNHIHGDNLGCGAGILLACGEGGLVDICRNQILGNTIHTIQGLSGGGGIAYHNGFLDLGDHEIMIRENILASNSVTSDWNHKGVTALGGAIFVNEYKEDVNLKIFNNIIADNLSDQYGGGLGIELCEMEIYNNTMVNNVAPHGGNSLFVRFFNADFPDNRAIAHMYNNILWSEGGVSEIRIDAGNILNSRHNSVKGGFDHVWDMHAEPIFTEGGYALDAGSPCIGAGADSVQIGDRWYYAPSKDFAGNPRKVHDRIDLGAFESAHERTTYLEILDTLQSGEGPCSHQVDFTSSGGIPPFTYYLDEEDKGPPPWDQICNGDHRIKIVDGAGDSTMFILGFATALEDDLVEKKDFRVYPNPSHGFAILEFTLEKPGYQRIELVNVLGQIRMVLAEGYFSAGLQQMEVSLGGIEGGVYFIRIGAEIAALQIFNR